MPVGFARRAFNAAVLLVALGAASRIDDVEDGSEHSRVVIGAGNEDLSAEAETSPEQLSRPPGIDGSTIRDKLEPRSLLFESLELDAGASSGNADGYIELIILFLPFIIAAPAAALFVFYVVLEDEDMEAEIDERAEQLEDLGNTCDELADKVKGQIEDMVEKQIDLSQHDFNHKKEDFVSFLEFCTEHPEKFGGDQANTELGVFFRDFVRLWLNIFAECSRCPVLQPMRPIAPTDFDRSCPWDIVSIGTWVGTRFQDVEVVFVDLCADKNKEKRDSSAFMATAADVKGNKSASQNMVEKAKQTVKGKTCFPNWLNLCGLNPNYVTVQRKDRSPAAQKHIFPFELMILCYVLKVNFVSPVHLLMVIYLLAMIPCCYYFFTVPHLVGALLILVAWAMLLVLLFRFEKYDVVAQLQAAQQLLIAEKEDVARIKKELDSFYKTVDGISRLWACKTRPRLDLMKQVMRKLMETRWPNLEACKEFLTIVVQGIKGMEEGIGGIEYYYHHPSQQEMRLFGKDGQALMRKQLEKVVNVVKDNDAKDVTRKAKDLMVMPNLLALRVLGCHALPKGTWTDNYDPYVRMRAKETGDWVQTAAKDNEQDPRWHTSENPCEFRFNVEGLGKQLECEVMDDNFGEDVFMGEVFVAIDEIPCGRWTKMKLTLQDPVDPSTPGALEIEVFLARESEDLLTLMPYDEPYEDEDAGDDSDDEKDSDAGSFL